MEKYKELFKEFMKAEYLKFIEVSKIGGYTTKITLSDCGCCDHVNIIYIYDGDQVEFANLNCDIQNLNLLFDAISKIQKM